MGKLREKTINIDQLRYIRYKRVHVDKLWERIERLRAVMERSTPVLSHTPRAQQSGDKLAKDIARLDTLERKMAHDLAEVEGLVQAAETLVATLPEQQACIVRLRYLDGLKWEQVAKHSGYACSHCKRIHTVALKKMKDDTQ